MTAEVLAVGFIGLTEDDVDWWVELVAPDGQVVGPPLATGKGFAIEASWDGTIEGVPVEDPEKSALKSVAAG